MVSWKKFYDSIYFNLMFFLFEFVLQNLRGVEIILLGIFIRFYKIMFKTYPLNFFTCISGYFRNIIMLYSYTIKLVRFYDGVDGLKTGYTETAGYCLTATAKKDGMRILTVVMGEPDSKTRNKETTEMLDYAFANYKVQTLLKDSSNIGKTKVLKGKDKYATLIPTEEATILNKKIEKDKKATYEVSIESIEAPIKKGDVVGKMTLLVDGKKIRDIDVTVSGDIEKANFLELFWNQLKDMISGTIGF